ncbi:MAG TPA: hypothetical protein VM657_02075 [Sphingomonas sp.]|nr:hypothetical protein [Sphingomonas sp.]
MESGQLFVLAIIAISLFAGVMRFAIMAKHGYPLKGRHVRRRPRHPMAWMSHGWTHADGEDEDDDNPRAARKIELLSAENERLTGQIGRLEERLRVLERIATDPAERTARDIEALRDHD